MATTIKSRFPLLLLLGIIFLGSVCVSYGIVGEKEERHPGQWKPPREREDDERRPGQWRPPHGSRQEGHEQRPGEWRPSHEREEDEEDEHQKHRPGQWRPAHEREEDEEDEHQKHRPGQWRPAHEREEDEEDEHHKHRPGQWRPARGGRQEGQEHRPGRFPSEREEYDEDECQERRPGQQRPTRGGHQESHEQRPGRFPSEREEYDEDERQERRPGQQRPTRGGRHEGQEQRPGRFPSEREEYDEDERQERRPGQQRPTRGGRHEGQEQRPGRFPSEREEYDEDERQERRPGQQRPTRGGRHEGQRPGQFPSEREEHDDDERHDRRPGQQRPTREGRWEGQEQHPEQWRPSRGKEEDEKDERQKHQPGREREKWEKRGDEEWRGRQRREDPDERARLRHREERRQKEEEHQKGDRPSRTPSRRERGEEEEGSSESEGRRNPFFFRSNRFQTLFENENGHIRLIQRFDKRSNLFQNLKNYRLLEYRAKPHTIFLPHHTDADFILVVLSGKAILTVLNPNNRNSFNLEQGDTIKLPAGTTAYLVNQDNDEDLRVVDLVIPVNRPGKFQAFDLSGNQNNPSYFRGFSKSILEASFNTDYETIERVLLEEHEHEHEQQQWRGRKGRQQSQEANAIVKLSREQIEELRRHAKSSSKKSTSSESGPFNLRSRNPNYSNKFGKFFEITPEKNPQLQDLDIFVSLVEINEGALLLPHYNSRSTVVLVINEGKGRLELVGHKSEQQEQREEDCEQREQDEEEVRNLEVQRYNARLSPGDVVIIPAGHPVAINASSNLNFLGFGLNAENNQRNFLAGENDNVISQIERPVKEVAFPGSAEEVDRLIKNQRQSYFANAQPQQREEGSQKRKGPLFSILSTLY